MLAATETLLLSAFMLQTHTMKLAVPPTATVVEPVG